MAVEIEFEEERGLARFFTFQPAKQKPFYNWFYFKEAFSPEFVNYALKKFEVKQSQKTIDPFCGVGTTLLSCKERGIASAGLDASPLCVLASRVKTRDYDDVLRELIASAFKRVCKAKFEFPKEEWRFELFNPRRALPKGSFDEALHLRKQIREIEPQEAREFLALALASAIPEASLVVKDGGVLKINARKKHRVPSLREAFVRRVRRMLRDLHTPVKGPVPEIFLGDARQLPFCDASFDCVITSPPYLNGVDYSKIYGLELSLLFGEKAALDYRTAALHSFVERDARFARESCDAAIAESCLHASQSEFESSIPLIAQAYFEDLTRVLRETKRVLSENGKAVFVVGNAVLPSAYIAVDEVLARIALEIGFSDASVLVGAERVADVNTERGAKRRKVRESAVLLCK
ncbi:MAG: class I SAM-dependent methyltransferase [Candidatus Norongarragalinales archaeon]